jgi:hypothetical protein
MSRCASLAKTIYCIKRKRRLFETRGPDLARALLSWMLMLPATHY